ncbi:hypothetical protein MMC28_005889 [Mycoblastus sanguinarius]|nr:hypothetical protein [Mycoblastus sanguinarius]
MPRHCTPVNSHRFFSTLQRYISATATTHPHPPTPTSRPLHPIRPHHPPTLRHASTTSTPPPPKAPTHYDLFPHTLPTGPPPHGPFAIDTKTLRREFLQLQSLAHPDRHAGSSKARAEGTSALINTAYKILQHPLLRAQYILSLRGIDVAEDETAKVEDPELLGEVLETRERIEAAEEEGELEGLKAVNGRRVEGSVRVLEEAFGRDDLEGAHGEAVRLRYWINIQESLEGWERGKPVVPVH